MKTTPWDRTFRAVTGRDLPQYEMRVTIELLRDGKEVAKEVVLSDVRGTDTDAGFLGDIEGEIDNILERWWTDDDEDDDDEDFDPPSTPIGPQALR